MPEAVIVDAARSPIGRAFKGSLAQLRPEETAAYMSALPQPWIAYKVLAAGAIPPSEGFKYAFRNGADFICVGMYDFQIVEDVNMALAALGDSRERSRRWIA